MPQPVIAHSQQHSSTTTSPERRRLEVAVTSALAAMPDRRREVCRMRWIDGIGPAEIARRLGITVKTVETQLSRGKRAVNAQLEPPLE
jgi:RNA polymerase sigma-70 factor (ECF subfamily)